MEKQESISKVNLNFIFKGKYKLKHKLKSGGFGSVYLAQDLKDNKRKVAVKVMKSSLKKYAEMEFKMYKKIQQHKYTYGFTKNYQCGIQKDKYFLAMQLLDQDLEEIVMRTKNKRFSLKTVLMIALQLVDRIQAFHKIGYLHRDIKPDNFVIGLEQRNKIIYLIDFGLAKKKDQVRPEQKGKMLGSLAYMSCKSHQGKPTGSADDIESLIYSMLFLLTGSLPWMKLKIKNIADAHKILILKNKLSAQDFKNFSVPSELFEVLNLVKSLKDTQQPDYLKIKFKFLAALKYINAQNDFCFDWSSQKTLSPQKMKKKVPSPEKIKQQKMKQQNQKFVQKQIYEVYKFLDDQKPTQSPQLIKQKQNPQKRPQSTNKKPDIKAKINNDPPTNKVLKRPGSALNGRKKLEEKNKQQLLRDKIAQIDKMRYQGPNITINRTAKHKI